MSNCGNKKPRSEIKICEKPVNHQYGAIENCIIDKRISETSNRKSQTSITTVRIGSMRSLSAWHQAGGIDPLDRLTFIEASQFLAADYLMERLRHLGRATPVLRHLNWIVAAW